MDQDIEPRAGTFSDWNINVAGVQGQQGATGGAGPTGPQGMPGPIGSGYQASSTTSLPLATGPINVATQSGLAYTVGARVRLSSSGTPTAWMEGLVTSYSGSTLVVNVDLISTAGTPIVFPQLPGYIGGLTLSNDATSPNTVLDIALGAATSDDYTTLMALTAAAFKKNCNAAWSVGNGNGALDSGSALAATTSYHVYLIERVDTQVVDVLLSTSASNPALPTNYTKRRRIGSIKTNASAQILQFIQIGDEFLWTSVTGWDLGNQAVSTTPTLFSLNVPTGIKIVAIFNAVNNSTAAFISLASPDTAASGVFNLGQTPSGAANTQAGLYRLRTNTAGQILASGSAAASGLYLAALGWVDNRGK